MDIQRIKKLLRIIERAGAYVVGESPLLMTVTTAEPVGEEHNEILTVTWTDDEGYEHSYHFQECAFDNAEIKGGAILVRDETGEEILIQLFSLEQIDVAKEMAT